MRQGSVREALLHDVVLVDVSPEDAVCGVVQVHGYHVAQPDQRKLLQLFVRIGQVELEDFLPKLKDLFLNARIQEIHLLPAKKGEK